MLIRLFFSGLLSLTGFSVHAGDLPYEGTWQGEIAGKQVMVCFSSIDAQYYYLQHRQGISLDKEESTSDFSRWKEFSGRHIEGNVAVNGIWTIPAQEAGDKLELSWASADGKQQWPVSLKRVKPSASPSPGFGVCGMEFYAPIEQALRPAYQKTTDDPRISRTVSTDTGRAFEVSPLIAGSRQFNRHIQRWLLEVAVGAYDCLRNGGREWGGRTLAPQVWSKNRLVVKDDMPETYCGGNYGSGYLEYMSFDLRSGHQVDTWTWLRQGKDSVEIGFENEPPGMLRKLLEKQVKEKECRPYNQSFSVAAPYATEEGMVFKIAYSHAIRMCDTELLIPYPRLQKYLTPAGKAVAAEMK